MNVGSHGVNQCINNQGNPEVKPPPYLLACFLLLMLFSSPTLTLNPNWQIDKLTKAMKWCFESFLLSMPLISSFFLYFISISSSHATCDFSPSFSPNFLYFHKQMPKIYFFLFKSFSITFTNFPKAIINKKWCPLGYFSQHSTWNMCPMTLVLFFLY